MLALPEVGLIATGPYRLGFREGANENKDGSQLLLTSCHVARLKMIIAVVFLETMRRQPISLLLTGQASKGDNHRHIINITI